MKATIVAPVSKGTTQLAARFDCKRATHSELVQALGQKHHMRRLHNIDGSDAPSHVAVMTDRSGRQFRAIVTVFPSGSNGLLEALADWRVRNASNPSAAPAGCIVILPMLKLRTYHPGVEWLQEKADAEWLAWAYEIPSSGAVGDIQLPATSFEAAWRESEGEISAWCNRLVRRSETRIAIKGSLRDRIGSSWIRTRATH